MTEMLTRDAVDTVLTDFFEGRIRRADALAEHYTLLWQRLARSSLGGKRLRPRLLLDTHRAFGAPYPQDAAVAAASFELLHTALLLHDDVIDRDLSRRGRRNLPAEFAADATESGLLPEAARSWGDASGILGGDLLLSATYSLLARVRPAVRGELTELVDEHLFRAAAGEHDDVAFGLGTASATTDSVLRMMAHKTAGYSFAAPLCAGAVLAEAGDGASADLEQVGVELGVLYQLRDDVLGVFGDSRTGKSTLSDLRQGKRTLLVAFAEGHPEWIAVRHLWGDPDLDEPGAELLRSALVASGARTAMTELIETRRQEAVATIGGTALPAGLRKDLAGLATRLTERAA
ncbi:polyprenyl synthetase family protein [Myceligenerans salitolerans]|uniref:Polyprenyl synthetase family protein n=1 Tax=Myceligenerans salitolerans TaxID=1230528 RepID=A0ABS3I485_9MICO|nr:polyprenyl synthetase family protein [Myceligenerans salitolerans]MBO0607811.1 polyprenyl synthetase family protein [Myceligenerans salitolerans]